jgi:hypothetical protein
MNFGELKKVNPREIWLNEATHFTPWLCNNISELGKVIGLELEITNREAGVGDFSLDILAKDITRNRVVVIENQLEPTDHKHLGQVLTYAAGFDAGVVIWVAQQIREEHRQAVDWLNQNTSEKLEFFAVEIDIIRIDDSKPALNFKLKAYPNEWQKTTIASASIVSDTMVAYKNFFQKLIDELREKYKFTNARIGQLQSWYAFASGVNGIIYGASFARGGKVRTEVYFNKSQSEFNKQIFDEFFSQKESIESEFGEELTWERLDDKQASRIAIYGPGSIDMDSHQLDELQNWIIKELLLFKKVFGPKLLKYK